MRSLVGRINKLEQRMGLGADDGLCVIMMHAGQELALGNDQCIQIMVDAGYILPRPIALLHFDDIPDGLSTAELERHLREYVRRLAQPQGAEVARSRR